MKLRPRIALGLLPLLLLFGALGGWAALVNRQLARELSGELKATYSALQAGQKLRETATQMSNATALASRNPFEARRRFDLDRAAFQRVLMEQSHNAAGTPRAPYVDRLDRVFLEMADHLQSTLASGGGGSLATMERDQTALYAVLRAIDDLAARDQSAAGTAADHAEWLAGLTTQIVIVGMVVLCLVAVVLVWRLPVCSPARLKRSPPRRSPWARAILRGKYRQHRPTNSASSVGRSTPWRPNCAPTATPRSPKCCAPNARWKPH